MPATHAFAAYSLDRMSMRRRDGGWLAAQLVDPAARVLLVNETGVAVVRRQLLSVASVHPSAAPDTDLVLLGVDAAGPVYALDLEDAAAAVGDPDVDMAPLRSLIADLDAHEAGLLAYAAAMAHWHRTHRWCGRCGAPTVSDWAGHLRRCPGCGRQHFPRTDPAVIMLVVDEDERALLGRPASRPPGSWSTLAGFVEPGETLEGAVAREVLEETGIIVDDVHYQSSQPWPFPGSLMLGFVAAARSARPVVDPEELAEARWWSRAALMAAIDDGSARVSPPMSIAYTLLAGWLGSPTG